jgi:peroxiredoxin
VKRVLAPALVAAVVVVALAAAGARRVYAHLEAGAHAPPFALQAALGGEVRTVDLAAELAKGPVVLYFFPKSFTSGCTVEAHEFSDRIRDYRKLGATVIGVSGDDIETQKRFSTLECRSSFLVASDPGLKVAKAYRAVLADRFANRTSYVIAANGTIVYAYSNLDPKKHVGNTLDALRKLEAK